MNDEQEQPQNRVATVEDEKKYVPEHWQLARPEDARFEPVWMVNDRDGLVSGTMVDTECSVYCNISIIKLDPNDPSTWSAVSMDDNWIPCEVD